jgi:hypothetical protein
MDADRRRRFVDYFKGAPLNGDRAKLIQKTKLSKGRIAQLFDEDESFGERAARNLAVKLGLAPDYFERTVAPSTEGLSAESLRFAALYESLSPKERLKLQRLYQVVTEGAEEEPPEDTTPQKELRKAHGKQEKWGRL